VVPRFPSPLGPSKGHRQVGGGFGLPESRGFGYEAGMTSSSLYAGHRFPPELISYMVWLYVRFPLRLRMVEEMLAFRGIEVSHETGTD